MQIIQGSNDPIVLEVEDTLADYVSMSAVLNRGTRAYKKWSMEDMVIQGNTLILKLSESETIDIPEGVVTLDIKGKKKDGLISFMEEISYDVIPRQNKERLDE